MRLPAPIGGAPSPAGRVDVFLSSFFHYAGPGGFLSLYPGRWGWELLPAALRAPYEAFFFSPLKRAFFFSPLFPSFFPGRTL